MNYNENINKILMNQKNYMDSIGELEIPEDKVLSEIQDCSSCLNCFNSSKKKVKYIYYDAVRRCKIWNNMIIEENIKCDFYKPIMVSGIQQLMMLTIRRAYPNTIASNLVEEKIYKGVANDIKTE